MKIDDAISLAALLSDAQEHAQRGQKNDVVRLLNLAKQALFEIAHKDAGTDLDFTDWLKDSNAFVSTPRGPMDNH